MTGLDANLALKAMVVLKKAHRSLDNYSNQLFQRYKVTPTQFAVLDVLYSKGEMTVGKLIKTALITSGNMTVVLKNMEAKGWIYRRRETNDKRAFRIGLTADGKKLISQILPHHIEHIEAAFACLEDAEKEELIAILKNFKTL